LLALAIDTSGVVDEELALMSLQKPVNQVLSNIFLAISAAKFRIICLVGGGLACKGDRYTV
jgi:hypothetical protein